MPVFVSPSFGAPSNRQHMRYPKPATTELLGNTVPSVLLIFREIEQFDCDFNQPTGNTYTLRESSSNSTSFEIYSSWKQFSDIILILKILRSSALRASTTRTSNKFYISARSSTAYINQWHTCRGRDDLLRQSSICLFALRERFLTCLRKRKKNIIIIILFFYLNPFTAKTHCRTVKVPQCN